MKPITEDQYEDLCQTLVSFTKTEDIKLFLEDLCTRKEVEQMAARLYAARLLSGGATYQHAIEESGLSSATVSRVSRCLQYGQGYNLVIEKSEDSPQEASAR